VKGLPPGGASRGPTKPPASGSPAAAGGGQDLSGVTSAIGSAAHTVASPFESIASGVTSVSSFLGKLSDPHFWLRAVEVVGGVVLVLLGLYLLARQVGLAQPVEDAAAITPVGRGAKLGEAAAAEMQFSAGRAASTRKRTRRRSVDVSEAGERRAARRRLTSGGGPSDEIPF
jgi:hypothetical protein